MPTDPSTLISPDATREILLLHTIVDGMGISVSVILLRALLALRRSGEVLPGLLLMIWLMLITELLRAVWLAFLWFSRPAPLAVDLLCFVAGFVVLVGVPIIVSMRYLPRQNTGGVVPVLWVRLERAMLLTAIGGLAMLLSAIAFHLRGVVILGPAIAYVLTALFLLSRVLFYRHLQVRRRPLMLFVIFTVSGLLLLAGVAMVSFVSSVRIRQSVVLATLNGLALVLVLCGIVFLFANVRLADVIVKRSMRIVLGTCGSLLGWFLIMRSGISSPSAELPKQDIVCFALVCSAIAFSPKAEQLLNGWISSWVFEHPDLQAAVAAFWVRLFGAENRDQAFALTEEFLQDSLNLETVHVHMPEGVASTIDLRASRPGPHIMERATRIASPLGSPVSVAFPLFVDGQPEYVITLSQGAVRPPLTQWEMDVVERVAARLQIWLGMQSATDRARREASLQEELTSAELRALRAQVNPHFLFNSLNTIADLAVTAPDQAEEMTVRLSSVFRYVLVNADRQFSSLKEELDFARSYLLVEQTRFGDRLKVQFDVDPLTLEQQMPTLLLQPLIENALKHGLAPRREGGTLAICSRSTHDSVLVSVVDDGIGLTPYTTRDTRNTRVGVLNVANRLKAAYGTAASFTLQPREQGGTVALVRVPKDERV